MFPEHWKLFNETPAICFKREFFGVCPELITGLRVGWLQYNERFVHAISPSGKFVLNDFIVSSLGWDGSLWPQLITPFVFLFLFDSVLSSKSSPFENAPWCGSFIRFITLFWGKAISILLQSSLQFWFSISPENNRYSFEDWQFTNKTELKPLASALVTRYRYEFSTV